MQTLPINPFHQSADYLCGPASLKMVLEYYGFKKTEKEVARLVKCTSHLGTKTEDIVKGAKKLGFQASFEDNLSLTDLRKFYKQKLPAILLWFDTKFSHYSVFIGIDKDYVYFADPQDAKLDKMRIRLFRRIWFGFAEGYMETAQDLILRRAIIIKPKKKKAKVGKSSFGHSLILKTKTKKKSKKTKAKTTKPFRRRKSKKV